MYTGFLDLPWWGYIVYTLVVTHITIAGVTIYLHRHSAHRALDLHPIVSHFFRFWLWLTTGMLTKHWTAIHRKHHAKCETVDDPHSPQIFGIRKVLLQGAELYRQEGRNKDTLERYGYGTPDDWLERNVYCHDRYGIAIMLITNVILLGPIGITIFAVQMLWIPFLAAGVINGIGHYWGYRNFQPEDASRNIMPWGILVGGEELHNNHHAYATSAKLSNRWYEFDIGWLYIRILETFGLAHVKKVAPKLTLDSSKTHCDLATLQAIVTHRYEVLAKYAATLRTTCTTELGSLKGKAANGVDTSQIKRWLHIDKAALPAAELERRETVIQNSTVLATVYNMRDELAALWQRSTASKEQLVKQLEDWCHRAENSGIVALEQFSRRLRCYA
jgi:stearoyl-CoA desaturase (Delta-9 desaturase)